jgi:ABC-type transport system involved in Fe-S cluster assembly fused permease/ATPase subunit
MFDASYVMLCNRDSVATYSVDYDIVILPYSSLLWVFVLVLAVLIPLCLWVRVFVLNRRYEAELMPKKDDQPAKVSALSSALLHRRLVGAHFTHEGL